MKCRYGQEANCSSLLMDSRSVMNSFLAVFWQHYKQASTRKEQESVLSYDWDSLIRAEDLSYRGDLPFLRRIQLDAVIHRNRTVLNLIELLERVRKGA